MRVTYLQLFSLRSNYNQSAATFIRAVLSMKIPLWVPHKQSTKQAIHYSLPASKPVISMYEPISSHPYVLIEA